MPYIPDRSYFQTVWLRVTTLRWIVWLMHAKNVLMPFNKEYKEYSWEGSSSWLVTGPKAPFLSELSVSGWTGSKIHKESHYMKWSLCRKTKHDIGYYQWQLLHADDAKSPYRSLPLHSGQTSSWSDQINFRWYKKCMCRSCSVHTSTCMHVACSSAGVCRGMFWLWI